MRILDPHIHMTSRTTDDYLAMHAAESFFDYFDALPGWEPFRAARYGIAHHRAIACNPKEANDPRCVPVLRELPGYLVKDGVVAVGFDEDDVDQVLWLNPVAFYGLSGRLVLTVTEPAHEGNSTLRGGE